MRTKQFDDLSGGLSGCGQAYKSPRRCVSEKLLRSKRIYVWEVSSGVPDLNVSDGHLSREWLVHRGRRMIYGCVVSPGRSRGSNLLLGPRLKADVVWSVHLLTLTTVSDCARTTYLCIFAISQSCRANVERSEFPSSWGPLERDRKRTDGPRYASTGACELMDELIQACDPFFVSSQQPLASSSTS